MDKIMAPNLNKFKQPQSDIYLQRTTKTISGAVIDDELVLLHLEKAEYHGLNVAAQLLWEWLKTPQTL